MTFVIILPSTSSQTGSWWHPAQLTIPRKTTFTQFFSISEWCRPACGVSTPSDLWGPRSPRAALERPVKPESLTGKQPKVQTSVKTAKSNQKPFSLFSSQFLFTCQDEAEEDWPECNDGGELSPKYSIHHSVSMLSTHLVLAESRDQQICEEIRNPAFHQGALTSVCGVEFEFTVMGSYNTSQWTPHHTLLEMHSLPPRYSLQCCVFREAASPSLPPVLSSSNNKPPPAAAAAAAFSFSGNHSLVCCSLHWTVNLHLPSVHYLHFMVNCKYTLKKKV